MSEVRNPVVQPEWSYQRESVLDLYFLECWQDLAEVAGDEALDALRAHALLLFKPEAVVGRRMSQAVGMLRDDDFVPVATATLRHTRHTMLDLWKYVRWTHAMPDWIQLARFMHTSVDTLLVVLRDIRFGGGVDASRRLGELKGPADRRLRREHQLRERLCPPNGIVNFVHSADTPRDIVRELGVLLDRGPRRRLIAAMTGSGIDMSAVVQQQITALEAMCDGCDFRYETSLARLVAAGVVGRRSGERLTKAASGPGCLAWDELCALIDPADERVAAWDFATIGLAVLGL